ncbi:hypothetical protein A2767_04395 [Candidatus Roizmanbacteria bacterium RIFCSPHIGHO2_01_FULL_35_10]|uniref:Uncharacterized protein n=1 Tax=Candidatus Roizmanbacteria bacterium RIFCSPLOWO2_01_FULL_35_13 TaxID=1802055 RepID=A0A1F7I8I5_9BACT|nr:MAG: hypothetical protein A2767_04395 [Candidatus Roizmanbacteria bacterium RIFCSPHIGHO2_01_FULL_35_10]OGK39668.1 MAG: hypothetical protein A3A74_07840 [Candidatus Roizmanbacteria bacterium RIFCSPLOWO2_01_FULL_35_13]
MDKKLQTKDEPIQLSKFTQALLSAVNSIKSPAIPDDFSKLSVSQTVSFVALVYEKVRNAVEFREEHLVLRAAIERILKRRLSLNPDGKGEAENLIRELLWARYFDNESLGNHDAKKIQIIIDRLLFLKRQIVIGRNPEVQQFLSQFLVDLATGEIEETLKPDETARKSGFTFYIFQVLRNKIKLEGLTEDQRDAYFLAAIEKAYRKSDKAYQRYHLFITFYKRLQDYSIDEIENKTAKFPDIFSKVEKIITNPYVDSLARFVKKQMPPFLILFDIFKNKPNEAKEILQNRTRLWSEVDLACREKYQQISTRLKNLAFKSFIYILLTKMILALILEFPVSLYFFNEVNTSAIIINSLFPPILMAIIFLFFRTPGDDNTRKIYHRIIDIVNADKSFETKVAFVPKKARSRNPVLIFGFTVFYSISFIVTLLLIYEVLSVLKFNAVSQVIFIFFVSVVTFFSYRIKQIVNEYHLKEKESVLAPIGDFFFMPILSLGKFLSQELSKLNFFIFIFDFLIEAPFKLVFEVVEEWISFVRQRKEEII